MGAGSTTSGEDSIIARYFKPLATDPGAFGLTDDAAILKAYGFDIVVNTDAIVEGDETGMVNAVLDQIARQFRADEFTKG